MTIRAVTQRSLDTDEITCTLTAPMEILDRVNRAEETLGEQMGAAMRDRLLQALAAMVIASLDEYRMGPFMQARAQDQKIEEQRENNAQKRVHREELHELGGDDAPLDFGSRIE